MGFGNWTSPVASQLLDFGIWYLVFGIWFFDCQPDKVILATAQFDKFGIWNLPARGTTGRFGIWILEFDFPILILDYFFSAKIILSTNV